MAEFNNKSTVYGPVKSWRLGWSLGIDPIFQTSICSFNCIYCQLGNIQIVTDEIKEYVSSETVIHDYRELLASGKEVDVITYSGSGEPSLASNLGEMIDGIREVSPDIPQMILTNATTLNNESVRTSLKKLDKVIVKIDALDEDTFQMINRPAEGVTLKKVLAGIKKFKDEFSGPIEIQTMLMPVNLNKMNEFSELVNDIAPHAIQINKPKRPYPLSWHRENRGNHELIFDYEVRELKQLSDEEYQAFLSAIKKELTCELISR
jgi:wyosine [tRNA(Phe)-imidazoG37] synthetase (radical SAM superfamily)